MQLQEAINLIQSAPLTTVPIQTWADFGCGNGLFTKALAYLLPATSQLHALDADSNVLNSFPSMYESVQIQTHHLDFVQDPLPFRHLDGVLMANSLHYVKDKKAWIDKLSGFLKPTANLLIIEYESRRANPWVPYPIDFKELENLYGWNVEKIGEKPSRFGGTMYAAWVGF